MPPGAALGERPAPAGRDVRKVTAYVTRQRGASTQLLVFRDPGHPRFGLVVPGGTVDDGERLEDALLREVYEESGLTSVRILRHLGKVAYAGGDGTEVTRHYFHCALEGACPETFTHIVCSQDEDDGWLCHYFWVDLDPRNVPTLGGRLGDCLDILVRDL